MRLNSLDIAVIAAYLLAVTLFGMRFGARRRTVRDYFLADRDIPWWAISLSIVAAETSTLTIIGVPGLAYETDFRFLQLVFGYLLGRILVSFVFIPAYFRGELVTAYELIQKRFGSRLRSLMAGVFLVTRAAAEGVRVFAVAIVVRIALGSALAGFTELDRDVVAIAIVCVLTLAYTFKGGLAAVIWTDVVQLAIYSAGAVVAVSTIAHLVPGGWVTIHSVAAQAGKFRTFNLSPHLHTTYTLWSGVIGGAFLTTASHGTDQLIVQRLLAARSRAQSIAALLSSGVAILIQFSLFLLIGAMLFVYYRLHPASSPMARSDSVFPSFIVDHMPHGVSGLLISAILAAAMSNLSAALNSLSSSTVVDFYARIRPESSDDRRVRLARLSTMVWCVVLFAVAMLARRGGRVLEMGLSIASVAYGSMLGVFLLGVLTRRASQTGAILGMVVGLALNLYLWRFTAIPFTWYVLAGSAATFVVGYIASLAALRQREPPSRALPD